MSMVYIYMSMVYIYISMVYIYVYGVYICLWCIYVCLYMCNETWITLTAGDHQKRLRYEKFELCSPFALAMWPPYRVHFTLVYSISSLHFLKFGRFSSHVKKTNDIKLVTLECKHIQPQKR